MSQQDEHMDLSDSSSSSSSSEEDELDMWLDDELEKAFQPSARYVQAIQESEDAYMAEGSSTKKKKRIYIDRERGAGGRRHYKDYFAKETNYPENKFRRRYRMRRSLFDRVFNAVLRTDPYFQQQYQATGEIGLTPYQKITAAFRLLAYGVAADMLDEYLRIGESTALVCLKRFCAAVVYCFSAEYLREPTADDRARILAENADRGFPGCLGSLDCMHWHWKNCPKAWQAQYNNYKKFPSIVLEGIASYDGWFWHVFFGMPGSLNDINVMQHSTVFDSMMNGDMPAAEPYQINGNTYNHYYYLGDGIYPKYSTIVKSIPVPVTAKEKCYAAYQEGARKDIERAFGQLQARWAIIKQPARGWKKEDLHNIMLACVILHNMICEDERGLDRVDYDTVRKEKALRAKKKKKDDDDEYEDFKAMTGRYAVMAKNYADMHDHALHEQMKNDLIEHVWKIEGEKL